MIKLGIITLKDLLEDFYISEIYSEFDELKNDDVEYISSDDIRIKQRKLSKDERKKVFSIAENRLTEYLKTFSCAKNGDVESYLHNNAIRMQKENISRTYLIINEVNSDIVAYFTIAIRPMKIQEHHNISKNKKKELKIVKNKDYDDELFFAFLIGQIGRNDSYNKETIRLEGILDYVFAYINEIKSLIGGRIVLIEVDGDLEKNKQLIKRYEELGFENFGQLEDFTQLMIFSKEY